LSKKAVDRQMQLLYKFLGRDSTFLELGPGDCQLSFEVAKYVKKVIAIDVSKKITRNSLQPKNFKLIISNDSRIVIPQNSIDIAYSYYLMEHLHPEDAIDQLKEIYDALIPGGTYICITPHRFTGPQDISKNFNNVATGFHLKEYTNKELYELFKSVGFSSINSFIGENGIYIKIPINFIILIENFIEKISFNFRKIISKVLLFGYRIIIIATK
jgi:ubiquinone/menaquinone biosynthesis C-methylase UbiE